MPNPRPNDNVPTIGNPRLTLEEYVDDQGVTRYKLMSERKMGPEMKKQFLEHFAEHGRLGSGARAVGTTMKTVRKAITDDPEFGLMVAEALECYKDKLIAHHQNLLFEGQLKVGYDRNGNVVSEERVYPIRLIELELKKHDEGYRDKREVSMNVRGGVLVAPATVSVEDWESKFGKAEEGEIVDGSSVDVTDITEGSSEDDDVGEVNDD